MSKRWWMSRTSALRDARLSASSTAGSGADGKDGGLRVRVNVAVISQSATADKSLERLAMVGVAAERGGKQKDLGDWCFDERRGAAQLLRVALQKDVNHGLGR